MISTVKRALEILYQDGPVSLARRTGHHIAINSQYATWLRFVVSKRQINNRMRREHDLDDILDTVIDERPGVHPFEISAMQLREELESLVQIVNDENPQTILEIGTANGGTFYTWTRYIDSLSTIVSLDLPGGEFGGGYSEKKSSLFRLFSDTTESRFVRANSHSEETFEEVQRIVDSELEQDSIDFLFIDGDHSYEGVKQDFEMYSNLVSEGGMIAFHDIAHHPDEESEVQQRKAEAEIAEDRYFEWGESHPYCEVDKFWDEIKNEYDTTELIAHPEQTWAGIGIVYIYNICYIFSCPRPVFHKKASRTPRSVAFAIL